MKRIHVAILCLVAIPLLQAVPAGAGQPASVSVGGDAPDFTLQTLDDKPFSLAKALEKGPVLLDFWALWCKPCLQGLPGTDELSRVYAEKGLTVLAVNTDTPRSIAKVRSYVKSKDFSFQVLLDPNGDMMRLYRFSKIPQLFLIGSDGKIAYSKLGYSPGQEKLIAEEVEKVLAAGSKTGAAAEAGTPLEPGGATGAKE